MDPGTDCNILFIFFCYTNIVMSCRHVDISKDLDLSLTRRVVTFDKLATIWFNNLRARNTYYTEAIVKGGKSLVNSKPLEGWLDGLLPTAVRWTVQTVVAWRSSPECVRQMIFMFEGFFFVMICRRKPCVRVVPKYGDFGS